MTDPYSLVTFDVFCTRPTFHRDAPLDHDAVEVGERGTVRWAERRTLCGLVRHEATWIERWHNGKHQQATLHQKTRGTDLRTVHADKIGKRCKTCERTAAKGEDATRCT